MKTTSLVLFFISITTSNFAQVTKSCMVFNGTTDYYEISDNSSLDFSSKATIEAWINPCDTIKNMIVSKGWCSGSQFAYYLSISNGKLRWFWNSNGSCSTSGGGSYYESILPIIKNNTWQHIAVVHSNSSINFYYNGSLISGSLISGSYGNIYNSNQPIRVGAYKIFAGSYSHFYNGRLDGLRMWNTNLSGSQIASRRNTRLTGTELNLVLYHNMDSLISGNIINLATSTGVTNNSSSTIGSPFFIQSSSNYPYDFNLGNDTTLCLTQSIFLHINNGFNFTSYLWNNFKTTPSQVVNSTGTYIGTGYKDFCFTNDTINVSVINCNIVTDTALTDTTITDTTIIKTNGTIIFVPNSFTPNKDGINDRFNVVFSGGNLQKFHLSIFTRWGELIFETTDKNKGWDGIHKGQSVKNDSYIWRLEYTDNKLTRQAIGHVNVLR